MCGGNFRSIRYPFEHAEFCTKRCLDHYFSARALPVQRPRVRKIRLKRVGRNEIVWADALFPDELHLPPFADDHLASLPAVHSSICAPFLKVIEHWPINSIVQVFSTSRPKQLGPSERRLGRIVDGSFSEVGRHVC